MFKSEQHPASRKLLSGGGEIIPGFNGVCNVVVNGVQVTHDQADWEMDSYGIIWVIVVIYLFLGIAVICDEQFTSSLESICNPRTGLGLSADVAGPISQDPIHEYMPLIPSGRMSQPTHSFMPIRA